MLVKDIISNAVAGELRTSAMKQVGNLDDRTGATALEVANVASILSFINQGLIELYKRFNLKKAEATHTLDGITRDYTISDTSMYLTEAYYTDTFGNKVDIPINSDSSTGLYITANSVNGYSVIGSLPDGGTSLTFTAVTVESPTPVTTLTDTIMLSDFYLETLLLFVSYKANTATNMSDPSSSNAYYIRFDASCRNIKSIGVVTTDTMKNEKLFDRGFV